VQLTEVSPRNIFITGGAGFLGSVFVEKLLQNEGIARITVFDRNAGNKEHSRIRKSSSKLQLIEGDLRDIELLKKCVDGHDTVIHLASNADIARAANDPTIDFEAGTVLTQNVLEAARRAGVARMLYASGSGVYGDAGPTELQEDDLGRLPISTYGASKLAGESLLSAYCHMFNITGIAFRFANIVGARQTHGIAFDFVEKLQRNPKELTVLGDGSQTKSYIHADDAFDAVWLALKNSKRKFEVFNVASCDSISVKNIAEIAIEEVVGRDAEVKISYAGGDRGWVGDIPVVKLNINKIRALGFEPKFSSAEAIRLAIREIIKETEQR